jgi:soluble lytic murein transglycosylase-like protein
VNVANLVLAAQIILHPLPVGWDHYSHMAALAAKRHGVPVGLFLRLLHAENPYGDPSAVNPSSGASGLGQFLPSTARLFGIDPKDPAQSLDASALYLRQLHDEFGSWRYAVISYNWGNGNVKRWLLGGKKDPIPPSILAYADHIEPSH